MSFRNHCWLRKHYIVNQYHWSLMTLILNNVGDKVFTVGVREHWPEEGWIQVTGVVVALNALLFSHHDIQTIVLCAWRCILMYHFTQVAPKCCINTHQTIIVRQILGTDNLLIPIPPTNWVASLYWVRGVVQGRKAGVRPAALELHKQGFFGWAGEVTGSFEGAVGATRTLFFLEEKVNIVQILFAREGLMWHVAPCAAVYSKAD